MKLSNPERIKPLLEILPYLPNDNLKLICENSAQFHEWLIDKAFYTDLNYFITFYSLDKLPPKKKSNEYQHIIESQLEFLLKLHDLLYTGWEFIERESERTRLDLRAIGASSPSDALKLILYNKSTHEFLQCKSHHLEYSPQRHHNRLKQIIKIWESKNRQDSEVQEVINDQKYKQLGVEYETDLNSFYHFCLYVVKKYRDVPSVQDTWTCFEGEMLETTKFVKKITHPSQKKTGFTWVNREEKRRNA